MNERHIRAGVDQGGTKTCAVVDIDGKLYSGKAAGACCFYTGYEKAVGYFFDALKNACEAAGIDLQDINSIGGGISGLDNPDEITEYTRRVRCIAEQYGCFSEIRLVNDCEAALYSEGDTGGSIAVMAMGTEFNAAIRPEGKEPFLYGNYTTERDLGGKAIGRSGIEAVILSQISAGEKTALTERLTRLFGCGPAEELRIAYRRNRLFLPLSAAAKTVFECAQEGDGVSCDIISEHAHLMSRYIKGGIRSFGLENSRITVLLTGGLMKNPYPPFENLLREEITSVCPGAKVIKAANDPVYGALYLAAKTINVKGD